MLRPRLHSCERYETSGFLWWAPGPGGLLRIMTQLSYATLAAGAAVLALQACQPFVYDNVAAAPGMAVTESDHVSYASLRL